MGSSRAHWRRMSPLSAPKGGRGQGEVGRWTVQRFMESAAVHPVHRRFALAKELCLRPGASAQHRQLTRRTRLPSLSRHMTNLSVRLGSLELQNPVTVASGTFGYGVEYARLFDLNL